MSAQVFAQAQLRVASLLCPLQGRCLVGTFLKTLDLVVSLYWAPLSFPSTLTSLTVPAAERLLVPSRHEEELVSSSRTYVGFFL